jgi:iron complex outermembrane receptor protein
MRVESGPTYNLALAGGGALADGVSARLAAIYENDRGYFKNPLLQNKRFPKSEMITLRPSLRYNRNGTDVTLFGDYGRITGDGTAAYSPDYVPDPILFPNVPPRNRFEYNDVLVSGGETFVQWHGVNIDARQEVGFGDDAALTLIGGYRDVKSFTDSDLDGSPLDIARARNLVDQKQNTTELRYNGTFGPAALTAGAYYFHQNALQMNGNPRNNTVSAARLKEDVVGLFGQIDLNISESLLLQVGARYSHEDKNASIAALASQIAGVRVAGANGVPGSCRLTSIKEPYGCTWTFNQKVSFESLTPKVAIQYFVVPSVQVYASWQKAFRSGGFNSSYNAEFAQEPFGPERQSAFELGFKSDLFDRRTRLNAAFYLTDISDLQRDLTIFDQTFGVTRAQTANTADARIQGFEVELTQKIGRSLVLSGNVSHTDAKYTAIRFDITQDPASAGGPQVTAYDFLQRIPRVMPWTYGLALSGDHDFGFAKATARISWTHRDASYFADYNFGRRDAADVALPASDVIDAQVSLNPAGSPLSFSIYVRNLTNEFTLGNFTPLTYPTTKTCACYPNKGRVIGAEVFAKF